MIKQHLKVVALFIGLGVYALTSIAATQPGKLQCNLLRIKKLNLNLKLNAKYLPKHSQIYFIHNNSQYPVLLNHPSTKGGAQAGWASTLHSNHWSALVVSQHNFTLNCQITTGASKFKPYPCRRLLDVCQNTETVMTKQVGDYWLVEDGSYQQILEKTLQRLS